MSGGETWHEPSLGFSEPQRVGGRYELLGLVGEGASGTVYRARDLELEEIVALKVLRKDRANPSELARLRQEVRLARRVTHPNVVRTFDLGEEDGSRFLTMEFLDGGTLAQRIADQGALGSWVARHVGVELCRGLEAAHAAGVVHRDLKPDNVMLGLPGPDDLPSRVAIADFGVAGSAGGTGVSGTPAYMAPEQVRGEAADPRADLYAVGAILHEMLTGTRLWSAEDGRSLVEARRAGARPAEIPAGPLATVITGCLAEEPAGRPGTAADLRRSLEEIALAAGVAWDPLPLPSSRATSVRVRPFASARADEWLGRSLAHEVLELLARSRGILPRADGDADTILDGRLRRGAAGFVLDLTLTSATDGYVLFADHLEFQEAGTLEVLERIAQRVAVCLLADLPTAGATAVHREWLGAWLRAREQLRVAWVGGDLSPLFDVIAKLRAEAPEDAAVEATHAQALARRAFFATEAAAYQRDLAAAKVSASRALALAPDSGEAHLAAAYTLLYDNDAVGAAAELRASVRLAPGSVRNQTLVGSLLLDAGAFDLALLHLDGAVAIEPTNADVRANLARLRAYEGRWDLVGGLTFAARPEQKLLTALVRGRFRTWSAEAPMPPELGDLDPDRFPPTMAEMARFVLAQQAVLRGQQVDPALLDEIAKNAWAPCPRWHLVREQNFAELVASTGDAAWALRSVERCVAAGLCDIAWLERCPPLAGVRALPAYAALHATVRARATAIVRVFDHVHPDRLSA